MLGIIFVIIAVIFVYRTARDNGYNAPLWAAITIVAFFGVQVLSWLLIGLLAAVCILAFGWSETILEDYAFILNLITLAASIGSVMLILRHVNTIRDDETVNIPPPPTFDGK